MTDLEYKVSLVKSKQLTEVYFCTQLWIHIRVTVYNGITGYVVNSVKELSKELGGSPQ
jgi:hypothetical protein